MAELLKNFFNRTIIQSIGADLQRAYPGMDVVAFERKANQGLSALSLTQRAAHICEVMYGVLPADYNKAVRIIVASLGPVHDTTESFGMAPFRYLPHAMYVARYGLLHVRPSLDALREITMRFTAESAIRPFIEKYPAQTYAQLKAWATHKNPHVRRLVSEGTRPRLPWAPRLPAYQKDPAPVLALLELLKDDTERYVQRSVANNLNDIAKDHPEVVVTTCARWLKEAPSSCQPSRQWIVRHALRVLVKKGDKKALALLGADDSPQIKIEKTTVAPKRAQIGGTIQLSCTLVSTGDDPQKLVVDYKVHYVKASGKTAPKVFKLKTLSIAPGESVLCNATIGLKQLTTRTHYPGNHRIELFVNGTVYPLGEFVLTG